MNVQVQLQLICERIYKKAEEHLREYSESRLLLEAVVPYTSRPREYITEGSDISIIVLGKWETMSKDDLKEFKDDLSHLCAELESQYRIKISIDYGNRETLQQKRFGGCFNECENSETE